MKNQSKPRLKLALRTETVRALDVVQLADVVGGLSSLPRTARS